MLLNFLDTDLYERQGKAITNFKATLPPETSELAQELTKDPYSFDFLTLTTGYREKIHKGEVIMRMAVISAVEKDRTDFNKYGKISSNKFLLVWRNA